MTHLEQRLKAIKERAEAANDRDPEKWSPETRSFFYPKWDEFALHAPDDVKFLLSALRIAVEALENCESGDLASGDGIYKAEIAREAKAKIERLARGSE